MFKQLLNKFTTLSEAETKDTKTGRVHKGDYGTSHEAGDEGVKKQETSRGRGRPKKDADETGEVKSYDTKTLGNVFGGGQKPKKDIGTVSKKHSLKEYMEEVSTNTLVESQIEEAVSRKDFRMVADLIKNIEDPAKRAELAQHHAQIFKQQNPRFSPEKFYAAVGIDSSLSEEEITIKPMPGASQIVGADGESLGTADPATANVLKQAAAKGTLNLGGQKMAEGKKAKPDFLDVDKDKNKKESFKKAVADKAKKNVKESISLSESPATMQHIISKYKNEVKRFIAGEELDTDLFEALFDYYSDIGEMPYGVAKARTGDPFEWITDRFDRDVHDHVVDENATRNFAVQGVKPTSNFTPAGSPMTARTGTPTKINRPVQDPTPWGKDPIAATTDRAMNFISGLGKKSTFEGTDMKDMQVESWENQLSNLLNEGITVSSSTGQQGSPDSVSVNATDADAQQLLQVLRQAGVGVFGGDKPSSNYGAPMNGDADGFGTEPEMSPTVVDDGDGMMALIKKMTGIQDSGEPGQEQSGILEPAHDGEEQDQDYEDEEGSEEEHGSAGHEEEDREETDEGGNAFGNAVRKAKQDGIQPGEKIKVGGKEYPVKEEEDTDHEHNEQETCNECGGTMYEGHSCSDEQVEEGYANEPDEEMMKLKALLGMGNDMHRPKNSQSTGNVQKVTTETKLMRDSSNLLADYKKLSGL